MCVHAYMYTYLYHNSDHSNITTDPLRVLVLQHPPGLERRDVLISIIQYNIIS